MGNPWSVFVESWRLYTPKERRNIAIYALGIVFYKFGIEAFNGSIITLATDRFRAVNTFSKLGALTGLNQAMQCVGAILIGPLIKKYRTRTVLAVAVWGFGLMTCILLIVDRSTGGRPRTSGDRSPVYGNWDPNALFPIYMLTGIFFGMVELIRRVIPRDIVGGHIQKLRKMDAAVHICNEVAGTGAAFATTALILKFGNNYSFFITPPFLAIAGICWLFVDIEFVKAEGHLFEKQPTYLKALLTSATLFALSIWKGAKAVCTRRKLIWLWGGYSIALYGHRYLEGAIIPAIARRVFDVSAYSQIMVGGSNFGELLGAIAVFLFSNVVKTPIPWLRLDALMLLLVWYVPYFPSQPRQAIYAWRLAALFIPVSFGWSAGDVSLVAYIQAILSREESKDPNVSALGAVMAFLYSSTIVIYAVLAPLLGKVFDKVLTQDGNIKQALVYLGGVQFTVLCIFVLANTFIPKGAFRFNPEMLYNENLEEDVEDLVRKDSEKTEETDPVNVVPLDAKNLSVVASNTVATK